MKNFKLDRFNKISLILAIGCAIGFYFAPDTEEIFLSKEMFFTLGATFAFFTIWK